MEVGAGGSSRGSYAAQWVARAEFISYAHPRFREMEIHGVKAPPVVQNDRFPGEEQLVNQGYQTAVAGHHGGSRLRLQVNPCMGVSGLPINNPPHSKSTG